jgi:hypothetical protein
MITIERHCPKGSVYFFVNYVQEGVKPTPDLAIIVVSKVTVFLTIQSKN